MKKKLVDFPAKELNSIYPEIEKRINAFFEGQVNEEIMRAKDLMAKYTEYYKNYKETIDISVNKDQLALFFNESSNHRKEILQLLESIFKTKITEGSDEQSARVIEECNTLLADLPEFYHARQDKARFIATSEENGLVKFIKWNKKNLLALNRGFNSVYNVFRKLFKLSPVDTFWTQKVPLKNIVYQHFVLTNFQKQTKSLQSAYLDISSIYQRVWKIDSMINQDLGKFISSDYDLKSFDSHLDELSVLSEIEILTERFDSILSDNQKLNQQNHTACRTEVEKNCNITGTLERSGSHYNEKRGEYLNKTTIKEFINAKTLWNNTYFILSEDWKLDLEIYSLSCLIYKDYFDFIKTLQERITLQLKNKIEEFTSIVNESQKIFKRFESDDKSDLLNDIQNLKLELKRKLLLKLVPSIKELILQAQIPEYIESIEKLIETQFSKLSTNRLIIKSPEYGRTIKHSEAESISPQSLVTFEMMPSFLQVFRTIKSNYINFVSVFQNELEEIPEILDFSLDSTISFYETNQDKEAALKISSDGFKRAAGKSDALNNRVVEVINSAGNILKNAMDQFAVELLEVTNNENAIQIKFRITKAKTLEKAKSIRNDVFNKIKRFVPIVLSKLRGAFDVLRSSTKKFQKQFIDASQEKYVSTEVSDYLSETQQAIDKLPFIYQRLFSVEPLQSFELFASRNEPLEKLKLAYDKWNEGKFAPVIVVGEKGCGKTSLLNRFSSKYLPAEQITTLDLHQLSQTPSMLYKEIAEAALSLNKNQDEKLAPSKKIILVDGLEKLFYANIEGFDFIKKTFHLISETNNHIFWIFTCHQYSWNYLEGCVSASDYFGYHVKLKDITDEILKNIILKRNAVSGYKLIFNPGKQEKKFSLFPNRHRNPDQKELQKIYFNQLNLITGGNIAIALLYWMRSTEKVTADAIYINSLNDLNLQFIRSISKDKMVTIRSLLIHNGMTVENYAWLFRITKDTSSYLLNQLLNDGILHKKQEIYFVNPMIYSQVVKYLKQLNLLS